MLKRGFYLGPPGCLTLLLLFGLLVLVPIFLANAAVAALAKLGLSPTVSFLALIGIVLGGLINIPFYRLPTYLLVDSPPPQLFGLDRLRPQQTTIEEGYMVLAVNVGGCLVPVAIAFYELVRVAGLGFDALLWALLAVIINIGVCNRLAQLVPGRGVALPPLIPALVAVLAAWLLGGEMAAPVAFAAGVLGPLIGADLLNLSRVRQLGAPMASLGGAGTFDGIVLSGLLATLLA